MASTALAIAGIASAVGGIASAGIGANAAQNASSQQVAQEQQALQFQKQIFAQQQQNQAPFLAGGQQSLSDLLSGLKNGTFGPGSTPSVPQFTGQLPQPFQAPTLQQAENYPGYQFTQEQGSKGILEGAAAAGGAVSGGTLKSLDAFNQNLATTNYGNVFSQELQGYGAGLQGYQAGVQGYGAQLQGYETQLQQQQQAFGQLYAPTALGENAATNVNATGTQAAQNVSQLLASIGASQSAGTIGTANAIQGGIGSSVNSLQQALLLSGLGGSVTPQGQQPGYGGLTPGQLEQLNPGLFGVGPGSAGPVGPTTPPFVASGVV